MPVNQWRKQSVFRFIQTQLRRYILENQLEPGDMLPPAAEMADMLGVSGKSLREAMRALEALGIVETKHGVGSFVRAYDFGPILENLSFSLLFERDSLRDLVLIREAMEVGLMPEAMQRIDEQRLSELETLVAQMRDGPPEGTKLDRRFHEVLFEGLGSELVLQFLEMFWIVYHDLTERLVILEPRRIDRWQAHYPILKAIQAGDVDGAIRTLRGHFAEVKDRITAAGEEHESLASTVVDQATQS